MPKYRTTVHSPWPADRAFAYLSDLENFANWDPGVKSSVQVAGEGVVVGAAFDVTVGGVPGGMTLRYEIVDLEPNERVEVVAETGLLRSVDVMTFERAVDGGSLVTYDADLSLRGVFGLGNPILGVVFGRIGDRAASGLRRLLEGVEA